MYVHINYCVCLTILDKSVIFNKIFTYYSHHLLVNLINKKELKIISDLFLLLVKESKFCDKTERILKKREDIFMSFANFNVILRFSLRFSFHLLRIFFFIFN